MSTLALIAVLVVGADQALKWLRRRFLGRRALPLGGAGSLRLVQARIWLVRAHAPRAAIVVIWLMGVVALAALATRLPSAAPWMAVLVGGTASPAIETVLRGSVTDYICLKVWPAFNLADVAITVGGVAFSSRLPHA